MRHRRVIFKTPIPLNLLSALLRSNRVDYVLLLFIFYFLLSEILFGIEGSEGHGGAFADYECDFKGGMSGASTWAGFLIT